MRYSVGPDSNFVITAQVLSAANDDPDGEEDEDDKKLIDDAQKLIRWKTKGDKMLAALYVGHVFMIVLVARRRMTCRAGSRDVDSRAGTNLHRHSQEGGAARHQGAGQRREIDLRQQSVGVHVLVRVPLRGPELFCLVR